MTVIAIDALGIGQPGGGRSATINLLRELLRLDTANHYLLLLDQPEPELAALGAHVEQVLVPTQHRLLSRAWGQLTWPFSLRGRKVSLVHHIKNLTLLGLPGHSVVTIYDLAIVLHPEMFPAVDVFYWRHVQPRLLRAVDRIIAISRQTASDITQLYGLPAENIEVIYPAYGPRFWPATDEEKERVRQRYQTGLQFILHVGSISRKKNLLTLLLAFEELCRRGYEGRLLLAGRQYPKGYDEAFYAHLGSSPHRGRILLPGPVPDEDLPALYSAAELMIFPSLHEGFGIVPLEAMACGTPVITSNSGALPEVVGGGATILGNPTDAAAWAEAAERLLSDAALRAERISRGLQWVKRYSATEAARQTLAVYSGLDSC